MKNKIAFIVPYPIGVAPSQRFRFEQYIDLLEQNNYQCSCYSFLTLKDYRLLYKPGNLIRKIWAIIKGFFKRTRLIFTLRSFSIVFIHREASPIGPPVFEYIITKILKKKVIYDFDDAIWLKNTSQSNKLVSNIKKHSKVSSICKWSSLIMCGNHYLMSYAQNYNEHSICIPTTIDTKNLHNKIKAHHNEKIIIGWTGTHSTSKYLYQIENLLAELQLKHDFIFKVISNQDPKFETLKYKYTPWSIDNEIDELLTFDIGLMPLYDDDWSKGKCGFKALQYMALEIPTIVSPVGVNTEIIKDGENGYFANNDEEWREKIALLINSSELRSKLGKEGRKTVVNNYSTEANKNNYLNYFNKLVHAK